MELDPALRDELAAIEQTALEAEAQPWTMSVEIRPVIIPTGEDADIADFTWAVKISTPAHAKMYVVGGEPGGPFQAIQRAIDKHAFKVEIPS